MLKRKLAVMILAITVSNLASTPISALANELENVVSVISQKSEVGGVVKAKVNKFELYGSDKLESYNEIFKLDNKKIKKISNNGGNYGSSKINKSIDGNFKTHWETGKANSSGFNNEVVIELDETTELNRIVYAARQDSAKGKGFAKSFEIYGTDSDNEDDYKLFTNGSYEGSTGDVVEIKFNPIKLKKIKFKFIEANNSWASAAEFMIYKEDAVSDKMSRLFTDATMSKVSEEFNTIDKINALDKEVKNHPLYVEYESSIKLARDVLENENEIISTIWELESRGDSIKESQKRELWNFQDWQPTGYRAKSGDIVNVYVDVEEGKPVPELVFKQMDSQHNGQVHIKLENGKNKIVIPEISSSELRPGTVKAGVLYTSNPYTPEQQGRKPKIRIEGANRYPHYIKGVDNDAEVMKELEEYVELLKKDPTLTDTFDIFSDKTLVNVRATYALDWYNKNNKLPSYTANKSDKVIRETMRFWGFDESSEVNSDFKYRYASILKWLDNGGFMNAGNGITGFNQREQGGALNVDTGWGFMHEMGHNFDFNNASIGETTNNILPLHFQKLAGTSTKITEQNLWERKILPKVALEDNIDKEYYPENDKSLLTHIAPMWQLQLYNENFWPQFEQILRSNGFKGGDLDVIHSEWVKVASDILKLDLYEHFARHGMKLTEEIKEYTSKYAKPDKKIWYINDKIYLDNGGIFTENVNYSIESIKQDGENIKLTFNMDKENVKNTLGYEIIRDGEIVGFTAENTFIDKSATVGVNHEYKIVAYDKEINPNGEYVAKAFKPLLSVEENVTLKLKSEFNPMEHIKATSYNGENISENVVVKSNNVDTSIKGNYEIVYEITDNEATETKTTKVEVTSDYIYASDIKEVSAKVGYRNIEKDKNPVGSEISLLRQQISANYKKGLGVHANSEVIYNIEDKNVDYFESYIGIDQSVSGSRATATFEVWVDGIKKYESGVFKHNTEHEFIKVKVSGAKEVKLITTDAKDGNGSDHTVWADAKFTIDSSKPTIEIPNSVSTKVGEEIDLGIYSAYDVEDGDLTNKVIVDGTVDFNKSGKYTLTYKVKDSDNNEAIKNRMVSVVDMKDYNYLTNYDWKSANNSYGQARKDKSASNNTLRLTDENAAEVAYERGIGTHSNSTIIYDLSDKNYDYFTSYVGVDRAMFGTLGSVTFQVVVDGVVKFDSGLMNSRDAQKYVEVDINGAKELKLVVTDGGNGNGSDHATWGESKLHYAKEKLNVANLQIPGDISTKTGVELILDEKYTALDEEDGDITHKVQITGRDKINYNKPGTYEITYTVEDNDGNISSKTRKVYVVNMDDYAYLSDKDWQSANNTFGRVEKDRAMTKAAMKLSGENGEAITYKKGLGTHSIATIIYDLTKIDAQYFTSFVGVDHAMYGNKGSVEFQVFLDGEKVYESGVMNSTDKQKFVEVELTGAKELKLIMTDGGNGSESDHGNWADAKLHYANEDAIEINRSNLDTLLKEVEELQ